MATKTTSKKPPVDAKAAAPRNKVSEQRETPPGANVRADIISDDELRGLIAQTAYYKAKERGFQPGYEQKDWLEAEAEVMNRLGLRA